jgi:very-short-patch-repair endonuclease
MKSVSLRLNKVAHLINKPENVLRYELGETKRYHRARLQIIRGYNHDFACLDSELIVLEDGKVYQVVEFKKTEELNILQIYLKEVAEDGSL